MPLDSVLASMNATTKQLVGLKLVVVVVVVAAPATTALLLLLLLLLLLTTATTPATITPARRVARASERPNRSCSLTRVSKRASERVAPVP